MAWKKRTHQFTLPLALCYSLIVSLAGELVLHLAAERLLLVARSGVGVRSRSGASREAGFVVRDGAKELGLRPRVSFGLDSAEEESYVLWSRVSESAGRGEESVRREGAPRCSWGVSPLYRRKMRAPSCEARRARQPPSPPPTITMRELTWGRSGEPIPLAACAPRPPYSGVPGDSLHRKKRPTRRRNLGEGPRDWRGERALRVREQRGRWAWGRKAVGVRWSPCLRRRRGCCSGAPSLCFLVMWKG